ncbi:MAG: TPM domain-containing protein [Eubacteriales bacterium]
MKKKILLILFIFTLCFGMAVPMLAEDGFADAYCRVMDMADLLSDSEEEALIARLDEIRLRQKVDVIVATTNDLEGYSVRDYADDIYDYCGFGYGTERDGVLLLISMEDRDWYISTCGYGISAFTDAGIEYIGEQIRPDLSEGSYAAAFDTYASLCDRFITQARSGTPYDRGTLPREPLSGIWIVLSILIGIVLSMITVGGMKAKLKTVRTQTEADSYVRDGSMNITDSRDMFLYHTVTRTAKPKDTGASGSSTHTSSSGTTHGGGGGKF